MIIESEYKFFCKYLDKDVLVEEYAEVENNHGCSVDMPYIEVCCEHRNECASFYKDGCIYSDTNLL